ncbi:protein adenylyltransferase SelO family protein, partial [Acinetobacter baumannii]
KGTGPTPYSRLGSDGRGTLRSMLREYLFSEAMHALGIPTTRSLAVISTGRKIQRQMVEEAGVLVRVAASHIRIGSFHYAAQTGQLED